MFSDLALLAVCEVLTLCCLPHHEAPSREKARFYFCAAVREGNGRNSGSEELRVDPICRLHLRSSLR